MNDGEGEDASGSGSMNSFDDHASGETNKIKTLRKQVSSKLSVTKHAFSLLILYILILLAYNNNNNVIIKQQEDDNNSGFPRQRLARRATLAMLGTLPSIDPSSSNPFARKVRKHFFYLKIF